ncbi:MAG: T9SS type A sorting domain-containing protein, partial [Bacteroidales bacterium]|nr:T9SS type A sorting domain-containing protein [Bacteroidales bacterium]
TDIPGTVSVSNDVVMAGIPFSTTVSGPDGLFEGAMVCISNGSDYFKGITDASGNITIDHTLTPGNAKLVITGFNLATIYQDIVVASADQAWIIVNSCEIDDSDNNNNGQADYGESVLLNVSAENVGLQPATGVNAVISSSDPHITITDNSYSYGDIAEGQIVNGDGAFAIDIAENIPDAHVAVIDIEFTDGNKELWEGTISITLHAPVLTIQNFYIDDSYGNNNGSLDPGENADIIVPNTNDGSSDALNSIATAITSSGLITLNNSTYDLETILAGETAEAIFNITVSSSAQVGDVAEVDYSVEATPYVANSVLSLNIGLVVEDFESGDFNSYDWEFSGNANWIINQVDPYEGVYSAKSGNISHNQTSNLLITIDVTVDDEISFFRKISSESGWDYLRFYIDGVEKAEWSGEEGWEEFSYTVTEGEHTFKWEYDKDGSVSSGSDCGWVDYIVFPAFAGGPAALQVTASANPTELCGAGSSQLNAFAMGGTGTYTYEWSPTTGLSDPNVQSPTATISETTTYTVTVSDGDNSVTDEVTVTVNPVPDTPTISIDGNMLVSDASDGNQWYDSNGPIAGATSQTYEPMVTDNYYTIVTNEFGCESGQSNTIYFIYTGIGEKNIYSFSVYPNPNNGIFALELNSEVSDNVNIKVLNSLGSVIYSKENIEVSGYYKTIIDLSEFYKGMYFLVLENYRGSTVNRIIIR